MAGRRVERETDVEKEFQKRALEHKVWPIKIWPFNNAGFPDRLCLSKGAIVFFVELKRPKGTVRPLQEACHKRLRSLGFEVYAIYSKEDVVAFFEEGIFSTRD